MTFFDTIADFFMKLPELQFGIFDFLDICLVAFVIYNGIKLIRETRAFQLVKGLLLLLICYFLVYIFQMQASTYMFRLVFENIFIILVIVFQQEIRQIIEKVGKNGLGFLGKYLRESSNKGSGESLRLAIIEICKAVQRMSDSKTGALIVMENETLLGDIIKTGTPVDAEISHELIGNIFFPNSPLHDGAAVVRQGRLNAAGCVLPLTKSENISSELGTRHRAAIGVSEQCDAIVIVVSEETGAISMAINGKLYRAIPEAELREKLIYTFVEKSDDASNTSSSIFKKLIKDLKK